MKYFNGLNMGEGIAGTDEIGAATTVIYTCMGVAFVNRKRRIGGLYHYPAKALGNPNVANTIRQMASDIGPDEIVLTPAGSMGFGGMGSGEDDIEAMLDFLRTLSGKVTRADPADDAKLFWRDGEPIFNVKPGNGPKSQAVPEVFRWTMSQGKRELEANIWYYGGDGETMGVLEQGLPSTKKSVKNRCVIL